MFSHNSFLLISPPKILLVPLSTNQTLLSYPVTVSSYLNYGTYPQYPSSFL
jgi:hypothetical protein